MKVFIKYFFINMPLWLLLFAFLCACSPQKRINRILNRNPELKQDKTVILFDTLTIAGNKTDTIVNVNYSKDTIVIRRDSTITKVFFYRDKSQNKAYISSENKPRQIIKKFSVTVPQIIYKYDDQKRWQFFWIGGAVFLFVIIVLVILLIIYGPKKL